MRHCPVCGGARHGDAERYGGMCIRCYVRLMLRAPARLAEWYRQRWVEATT